MTRASQADLPAAESSSQLTLCCLRRAVLLNVNEPELRGLALALQTVLDDVGKGLGPFLVAQLIAGLGRCAHLLHSHESTWELIGQAPSQLSTPRA